MAYDIDMLVKLADDFEDMSLDINDIKPTRKEDLEAARRRYQEIMVDPDAATEYRMQSAERQRQFMERQKAYIDAKNKRLAEELHELKRTGSLEALTYILGVQLASKRSDLKKRQPEALDQYNRDAGEIDYLRKKITEYLGGVPQKAKDASVYNKHHIPSIMKIARSLLQKFGSIYPAMGRTLTAITNKLTELIAL
jgi:hypothetical protein